MRLLGRWLMVLALTSVSGVATAEPSARELYAQGKAEYAQGHYVQAVQLFERSYALSESPALLFNMAQAHRLAGPEHCADAMALYKSYLAALPEAENRQEVQERIEELAECARAQAAPSAAPSNAPPASSPSVSPVPTPQPPVKRAVVAPPPPRGGLPTGPVLMSGAGAALAVAGGVLYWRAWEKHREAERVCPCYPGTYTKWEILTNVSYALLAVGGATLAGGVSWWVVAQPGAREAPAQALLGVRGRF